METNELANQVIEAMLEAVAVTDLDGTICYVNGEFERGSGWKRQEAVGKTVFELGIMAKEESRRLEDEIRPKLMKQGRVRNIETTAIRRDGTEFPVSMSWTLMRDPEGKATGIVTVAKDITELKKTEAGLRHLEEKWHSLVQNAADTILIVDRDGKIQFINHTVAGIFPAEAIGATIYDYVPLEHHDRLIESLERVFETGQGNSYEITGVGPHGILSWYKSRVGPVKQSGKIVAAAIIATDISLRKRTEQALLESESKYRDLVEEMTDVIYTLDTTGNVTSVNRAAKAMFGRDPQEVLGKSFTEWIPEDERPDAVATFERVLEGEKVKAETVLLNKQGQRHDVEFTSTRIVKDGRVTGTRGIIRDITESKRAEEAVRESKEKYRRLFDDLADPILVADFETGIITDCNRAASELMGMEKAELIGRHQRTLHPSEETEDQFSRTFVQHREEKQRQVLEAQVVTKKGEIRDVAIRAGPTELVHGKRVVFGMFRDITEAKRSEQQLNECRDRMTQAERLASVGTISAELVHRLAQPFTVIGLNMENSLASLQKIPSCPESVKQMLKEALAGLADATSIVELFRAFARKSERGVGPVGLKTVAERIAMLLERKASRARLALGLRGLEKLPPIYANEQDLEQLFFALVDNAIQAADGRRQRKLTVSGTRKGKYVELRFSDDCGGIPPENLDRVFEPFFTTKPAGEGTGLGLCIVQHVADQIGGKVRVESKLHKGSTFIVSLPIGRGKTF